MYFQSLDHTLHISKQKKKDTVDIDGINLFPSASTLTLKTPIGEWLIKILILILIYVMFYFSNFFVSVLCQTFKCLSIHF